MRWPKIRLEKIHVAIGRKSGKHSRRKSRGKVVLSQCVVCHDLAPIDQRRFIESVLAVEPWYQEIAALPHFAGGFSKSRFVAINQR